MNGRSGKSAKVYSSSGTEMRQMEIRRVTQPLLLAIKRVIVVDAPYLPSSAQADIEQIRKWTSKPVDILINTHWHADHQQGNAVYLKAFTNLIILAHEETTKEMLAFEGADLDRYKKNFLELKHKVEIGKNEDGAAFSVQELKDMKELYMGQDSVMNELKGYIPAYPNMSIKNDLFLDIGNQTIQVKYIAPMHTRGDILVYLPKDKILITGDVVVSPVPYFFGGGYPYTGLTVLEALNQMAVNTFVPGHGTVLHDKMYLEREIALLKYTISAVEKEVYKEGLLGIKLENVQKAIDMSFYKKQFCKGIKENEDFFDQAVGLGLVEGCFNQMAK